ncbi:MAG TPA: ribosome biogenesis GTPase YlqF [Gammaproteobacteria bacterium]|nr:ribosome biogenesis GTPase YlqF [Gammaproteobacteria bacterium]
MAIQWYPGHMHKARKKIVEAMPKIDLVIEVVDARLPFSSENPLVTELRGDRPCIKILNKSDLADPLVTKAWLDHLEQERGVKALAMTSEKPGQIRKISSICRQLLPGKSQKEKRIRTMIMGIPNVGKSTLINILTGKIIAKVGNEPAVTKAQQKIYLDNGIVLSDTPGILWPKIEDENSGYRLAVTGAIKNTAIEYEDIALYAAGFLLESYPQRVMDRYKLKELPISDEQLLDVIGRKRGGLRSGGMVDLHKASEVLIHDLRSGALGRVSLERPV